jgi:hypothetical protein
MTTTAYPSLTHAQQVFKDLIWTPMVKAGETYIEGVLPILAVPVIKQLDEALIGAITDWAFRNLMLIMDVQAIKLVNSAHQSAYDSASLQLKIVAIDHGINSNEYLEACTKASAALSRFTRFGGH